MPIEKNSFLSPKEQKRESEVLMNFFNLVVNERARYEIQAKDLLKNNNLEVQTKSKVIKYGAIDGFFYYFIPPELGSVASYSCQIPIPETDLEKMETLVEFFARSEAGVIS